MRASFKRFVINKYGDKYSTGSEDDIYEEIDKWVDDSTLEDKEKFLSGGVILGTLGGAYVGYKIGRAKPQKKGFETEKKVASKVKSEAKKVTDSLKKKK